VAVLGLAGIHGFGVPEKDEQMNEYNQLINAII